MCYCISRGVQEYYLWIHMGNVGLYEQMNTKGSKVLVVEDNDTERHLIVGVLQRNGYEVRDCSHIGAAYLELSDNKFDVIYF